MKQNNQETCIICLNPAIIDNNQCCEGCKL